MPNQMTPYRFTILPSAARTATTSSNVFTNTGMYKGCRVYINVSAVSGTSPTLAPQIEVYDTVSQKYVPLIVASNITATTTVPAYIEVYPGSDASNKRAGTAIGPTFRVTNTIGGTSPSFTFSLTGEWLN